MHWKGFSTNCASKIPVEHKVFFLLIHSEGGYIICCRVGKGKFIILIYVEIRKPRRERRNVSSLWIQLGTPFNKNADMRSTVHLTFALREFSKK
jgi:hypothetical protein